MFVMNVKYLHNQIALTSTNVNHTIVTITSYKKLFSMFLEIHSVYKKLANLIWKNLFLKSEFLLYCGVGSAGRSVLSSQSPVWQRYIGLEHLKNF